VGELVEEKREGQEMSDNEITNQDLNINGHANGFAPKAPESAEMLELIRETAKGFTHTHLFPYMIANEKGSKFPSDFKARLIRLAVREGISQSEIGAAMGIGSSTLSLWIGKWRSERTEAARIAREAKREARIVAKQPTPEAVVRPQASNATDLAKRLAAVERERDLLLKILERSGATLTAAEVIGLMRKEMP
jgi:transposase-like protein